MRLQITNAVGAVVFSMDFTSAMDLRLRIETIQGPETGQAALHILRCASQVCCLRGCEHRKGDDCVVVDMTTPTRR